MSISWSAIFSVSIDQLYTRIGILDIFLSFWLLAAFCALLKDREDGRRRLAARLGRLAARASDAMSQGERRLFIGPPFEYEQ